MFQQDLTAETCSLSISFPYSPLPTPTPSRPGRAGYGLSAMGAWSEILPVRRRVQSATRDIPRSMTAGTSKPPSGPKDPPVQSSGPPCSCPGKSGRKLRGR